MNSNSRQLPSIWMIAAVLVSMLALFYTSLSPYVIVIAGLFLGSLILTWRFPRDSANIWGVRLLLYAVLAILGRNPDAGSFFTDVQAFTSVGIIAGGEIVLQSWREPPRGMRFDGIIITLSGIVFLIACNTLRYDQWYVIWQIAPVYMATALLALRDLRPSAGKLSFLTGTRQFGLILIAVVLGSSAHGALLANRGTIMSIGARLLTERRIAQRAGIGDTSELGSGRFAPVNSTSRVARITGRLKDPHLRAAAFDEYVHGVWGPAMSSRKLESPSEFTLRATAEGPFTSITLLRNTDGQLYFPLNATSLFPAYGSSFDWYPSAGPVKTEDEAPYTYYFEEADDTPRQIFGMDIGSETLPITQGPLTLHKQADSTMGLGLPAGERAKLLVVPGEIDPRVKDLANRITADDFTDAEKALDITEYLLGNYKYSLDYQRGEGDAVSDFLLNKRSAHCQYFASGAVILLRSVGIPARYVTGYYAHEEEDANHIIVRTRDSHAWAEAYISAVGWVVIEATPPDGRADPKANPIPWHQKLTEDVQDTFAKLRSWLGRLTRTQILGLLSIILLLWLAERARQSHKKRKSNQGPVPPAELAPIARRFEKVLARHGIRLDPGTPWSESVPQTWPAAREFVDAYNRVRFDVTTVNDVDELNRLLASVEKLPPPPERKEAKP